MIGEMTAAWDRLGPIVLEEVKKRTLPHVTSKSYRPIRRPSRGSAAPSRWSYNNIRRA